MNAPFDRDRLLATRGRLDPSFDFPLLPHQTHLLIDMYEAQQLSNIDHVLHALVRCAAAMNVPTLHRHAHAFEDGGGISAIVTLAGRGHVSIHIWPEVSYAALDILTAGTVHPIACLEALEDAFKFKRVVIEQLQRGGETSQVTPRVEVDRNQLAFTL